MSRKPSKGNVGALAYMQLRVDGELKNALIAQADRDGVSLNTLMIEMIKRWIREGRGIPEPPPARAPLPSEFDVLTAWINGEQVLTPCGKRGTCDGMEGKTTTNGPLTFCTTCGIRVQ